jgi:hypothetical protein
VANTLSKLTIAVTAAVAATWFGTSSGRAYGDAPWCAVYSVGRDAYWDCRNDPARPWSEIRPRLRPCARHGARKCRLLTQSGHRDRRNKCPLLGVKRTSLCNCAMSAYDPKRTLQEKAPQLQHETQGDISKPVLRPTAVPVLVQPCEMSLR